MEEGQTHPLHIRVGHWVNALAIVVLLWTGFAMFANDRHFAFLVRFVPLWFRSALQLPGHAALGRAWHLGFAIVFIANAAWFACASIRTTSWRRIVPAGRTWFRDAISATIAEIRDPKSTMERADYNAAQKVAYTGVFVFGSLMILTGVALWFGRQLPWLVAALGGQRIVLPVHIILATSLLAFVGIHLAQVARAGLPTLLAMISGTTSREPRVRRRAFVLASVALVALAGGFSVVRLTSGPAGIPPYLHWAVRSKDGRGDGARHRTGDGLVVRAGTTRRHRSEPSV